MALLFADVLQEFYAKRKTGALFVVDQCADHMVRFYFDGGEITSLSLGPLKGKECLDRLGRCDFGTALFFSGLKPPSVMDNDLPLTSNVIEALKSAGKTVRGIQFTERGKALGEGVA
jgi:hypothetical protein